LALFSLGMIWAETVRVHRVAAALPLGVRVPSTERRLRRFLANPAVSVETVWRPLLPYLLGRWAGQEVVLVFDPTPHRADWTVLWVGIVVHRRVLPLSWGSRRPGPRRWRRCCRRCWRRSPPPCLPTAP
jgi:hypothetical protein